jgi:hypothetical protein
MPAVPATDDDLAVIAGTYASSYGPRQMTVQPDRTLTLAMYAKGEWKPMIKGLKLRRDGRFISDRCPETAYRLVAADGRRYLAVRRPFGLGHYEAELPDSHDLLPANRSQTDGSRGLAGAGWLPTTRIAPFWPWDGSRLCSAWSKSKDSRTMSPLP